MTGVRIEYTPEKAQAINGPLCRALNEAQAQGYTIDEVLVCMMVLLGSAIRQRGAVLHLDKPLREALPPIALGYEEEELEYEAVSLSDPLSQWVQGAGLRRETHAG